MTFAKGLGMHDELRGALYWRREYERERRRQWSPARQAAWERYLDLRRQIRLVTDDPIRGKLLSDVFEILLTALNKYAQGETSSEIAKNAIEECKYIQLY